MKKYILLVLLFIATINSSFSAEEGSCFSYTLPAHASTEPKAITLHVGEWLCVKGDKVKMTVGGDELGKALLVGYTYYDGVHEVVYQGGMGGNEGTKIIYNNSLWHFDENALYSMRRGSSFTYDPNYFNNVLGVWRFKALEVTPDEHPYEFQFINQDGEVALIEVSVI